MATPVSNKKHMLYNIVEGTNGRVYVTENNKVIHTDTTLEGADDWLASYLDFLQDWEFSRRYPGIL